MPGKENTVSDLQERYHLSEAEAVYVLRHSNGGDIDEVVAFVRSERVGPSAVNEAEAIERSAPRAAPHARIDELESRVLVLERERNEARAQLDEARAAEFRVAGQGTAPDVVDPADGLAAVVVPEAQADKIEANAEKDAKKGRS